MKDFINVVSNSTPFRVVAFNNKEGYFDILHETPSGSYALRIASAIQRLVAKRSYKDPDTGLFYDAVSILHGDDIISIA